MTLVVPMQSKKEQMYHYKHTTFHMNQSCLVVAISVHCLAALSDVQIPCSTYTGVHKPMQTCAHIKLWNFVYLQEIATFVLLVISISIANLLQYTKYMKSRECFMN